MRTRVTIEPAAWPIEEIVGNWGGIALELHLLHPDNAYKSLAFIGSASAPEEGTGRGVRAEALSITRLEGSLARRPAMEPQATIRDQGVAPGFEVRHILQARNVKQDATSDDAVLQVIDAELRAALLCFHIGAGVSENRITESLVPTASPVEHAPGIGTLTFT
jgi:hypothetical protein